MPASTDAGSAWAILKGRGEELVSDPAAARAVARRPAVAAHRGIGYGELCESIVALAHV